MSIILSLIQIYSYAIFGRVILSWFPMSPGGVGASIFSVLYTITEPVLGPLRRVIPPMGGFDLSPIVAFIGLNVLARAVAGG